jgi:DNA polymerase-3 subunit chi
MPKVDLYLIAAKEMSDRVHFTCRLVEKAFRAKQPLYLWVEDKAAAQFWDQALWEVLPLSFIPHGIDALQLPVCIGTGPVPADFAMVLVLSANAPKLENSVHRVLDIVSQESDILAQSRVRYRHYQQCAYDIIIHDLKTSSEESSNG